MADQSPAATGANSTRISFTPLMKLERSRRGVEASRMSGSRRMMPQKMLRSSMRARLAPRQKCSPTPNER
jgi:hypothetical protein